MSRLPGPIKLLVSRNTAIARLDKAAEVGGLPPAMASYVALALVAQALEAVRVDMQDGRPVTLEEALARITRAKEEGDRFLGTYPRQPSA